ncbi:MAG: chromosomal replication initiator protein DnaA [Gammaproteobacteria bacterium]|nr:chromosomal replication initiator protein DnaA [Gammaproteobacteria bacterium]
MTTANWQKCVQALRGEISQGQFNTWIRPLRAELEPSGKLLWIKAPNRFILDWVSSRFMARIRELMLEIEPGLEDVALEVTPPRETPYSGGISPVNGESHPEARPEATPGGSPAPSPAAARPAGRGNGQAPAGPLSAADAAAVRKLRLGGEVNKYCEFSNFVVGQSNQLAQAAALQVADNPGRAYNPLFIYGGVGLGKTHLMHAVGNRILKRNPEAVVKFVDCESFVNMMIQALRFNAMDEFKRHYRSVDALLLDDVQFLARKERSQEEFFHTFNNLLDGGQQIVLTCDRYYKAIEGIEPRLKSRFGWGLSVAVEPPELETRVAILMSKAGEIGLKLPQDAAVFIAQKVCSSGRELEGAIKKVNACAQFKRREVDTALVKEALWDLFAQQDKLISIDNIQRIVAQYYKINMRDMLSRRRTRSIARPRQVAMTLARELTSHSLPEIGEAFGGKDHSTVVHACQRVAELRRDSKIMEDDYNNLLRALTN